MLGEGGGPLSKMFSDTFHVALPFYHYWLAIWHIIITGKQSTKCTLVRFRYVAIDDYAKDGRQGLRFV